ncbi:TPA: hypothetical protein GXZ34_02105 [bacterium]|nr:hypothetical protein [bacterium]
MEFEIILQFIESIIKNGIENNFDETTIEIDIVMFNDYLLDRKLIDKFNLSRINKILENLSEVIKRFEESKNANLLSDIKDLETTNKIIKTEN